MRSKRFGRWWLFGIGALRKSTFTFLLALYYASSRCMFARDTNVRWRVYFFSDSFRFSTDSEHLFGVVWYLHSIQNPSSSCACSCSGLLCRHMNLGDDQTIWSDTCQFTCAVISVRGPSVIKHDFAYAASIAHAVRAKTKRLISLMIILYRLSQG